MLKKSFLIASTLILLMTLAIPFSLLESTNAQDAKNTFAGVSAVPNPVGVGQEVLVLFGITHATAWPHSGWSGVTVAITRPDGTNETLGPFNTDTTGLSGTVYVPNMVGNYILQTHFPEQVIEATASGTPAGTIMRASISDPLTLVVQEDPVVFHPGVPLPTEYWTRPISAEFREWASVSGSWLEGGHPPNRYAPYNEGPETGHILWTRQLTDGGLIGGEFGGLSYEHGDAYEGKFINRLILNGKLFYNKYTGQTIEPGLANITSKVDEEVVSVDLRTGEKLWTRTLGNNERLSFGQIMYWSTMNMHGAFPYLWTTVGATWNAYDPFTGRWEYNMTNVPSGINLYGPQGEIIRYTVNLAQGWMTKWNSTRVVHQTYHDLYVNTGQADTADYLSGRWRPQGVTFNATIGIEWNVSVPTGLPGMAKIVLMDRIIGSNTNWAGGAAQANPVLWGISIAPGQEGQLMFNRTWALPQEDVHVDIPSGAFGAFPGLPPASLEDDVFIVAVKETRQYYGFSLTTGQQLWGPTESEPFLNAYSIVYLSPWGQSAIAYGKLFTGGMGGEINAYNVATGERIWSYRVTDRYNEQILGDWPAPIAFITDGKIYVAHMEHSVIDPRPRGAPFTCLDVETGEEVFRIEGLRIGTRWGGQPLIADSIIIGFNTYDNRIYALGKGPSAITVAAAPKSTGQGSTIVIEGMVTDVSPGTEDYAVRARFPNGVPAVADESMSEWMNYVYMQSPRPTDIEGVEVAIDVIDVNGNFRNIGTAMGDSSGLFSFTWEPDIEGAYTVIATFAGSKSYWPSHSEIAFNMIDTNNDNGNGPSFPPTDTYFIPAVIAIIIAIAVVGALIMLMLRRRP